MYMYNHSVYIYIGYSLIPRTDTNNPPIISVGCALACDAGAMQVQLGTAIRKQCPTCCKMVPIVWVAGMRFQRKL